MQTLTFTELPSAASLYKDVVKDTLMGNKPGLKTGQSIPRIEAKFDQYKVDNEQLKTYNQVCGFSNADVLPITFPHIAVAPLHMAIMNTADFPIKLLGLVHVRNSIKQHRAIKPNEKLDLLCWIEGQQQVDAGVEFDLRTEIRVGNELVWEEWSTNLSRSGSSKKKKKKPSESDHEFAQYKSIDVPENIGRRYGAVSGDRNPIHMYDLTAKLLGFNKAIAHGMWSLSRIAAELSPMHPPAQQLDVAFKLPIFLPAGVLLRHYEHGNATEFKLISGNGKKPHAVGSLRRIHSI